MQTGIIKTLKSGWIQWQSALAELDAAFIIVLDVFGWSLPFVWRQCRFQSCQVLAVSCWKFCRECGRAVKLFCSSAHGIAVNLPHQKSDSSFLGAGNLTFSCFHLFPSNASCEPLECCAVITCLMAREQRWCGETQLTSLFSGSPRTLQPDGACAWSV